MCDAGRVLSHHELDDAVIGRVASATETSAADPQHQAMVLQYVGRLDLSPTARVVEVGCGTGAIARMITAAVELAEYVGTDPSPQLVARAEDLSRDVPRLRFERADGAVLPFDDSSFDDSSFDAAILHRVLSHVPDPQAIVDEAVRVLRPGGVSRRHRTRRR